MSSNQTDESESKVVSTVQIVDQLSEISPIKWTGSIKRKYLKPHYWLSFLVFINGLLFLHPLVAPVLEGNSIEWQFVGSWRHILDDIGLSELPRVVIAVSMMLMSIGMLYRARIAWAMATILTLPTIAITLMSWVGGISPLFFFTLTLVLLLIKYWSIFNRSSLAASSLFALSSFLLLIWYAFLGSLYLGKEFNPPIHDIVAAAYFSVVAMSTLGFGDIVPVTDAARLFTVSIVILGITLFATSLGAVIGPIVGGTLKGVFHGKAVRTMRKNHIILCGIGPFAHNVYKILTERGRSVTVIVSPGATHQYPENADIIEGDATARTVLEEAGIVEAKFVLAIRLDDPENAFIVLAVKEISDSQARTVAVVNNTENIEKIRSVKPDLVLSPQLLGAELLARALNGESMEGSVVSELFFSKQPQATSQS
jgi:voltage-gated potassium channel